MRALTDLGGLESLRGLRELDIADAPVLRDISSIASALGGSSALSIGSTPELRDFGGLERTTTLAEIVVWESGLESLRGLESLTQLGRLETAVAPSLRDLTGLQSLTSIETLTLAQTGLESLRGLAALRRIDVVEVRNAPALAI